MASFGDRLQKIRTSKGDQQQKAINDAVRAGISFTKISEVSGQSRESLIKKFADSWRK